MCWYLAIPPLHLEAQLRNGWYLLDILVYHADDKVAEGCHRHGYDVFRYSLQLQQGLVNPIDICLKLDLWSTATSTVMNTIWPLTRPGCLSRCVSF